jgi:hypothetical protein
MANFTIPFTKNEDESYKDKNLKWSEFETEKIKMGVT